MAPCESAQSQLGERCCSCAVGRQRAGPTNGFAVTGAQVAGYKVKCMLAEPKSNRSTRAESASGETSSPATSAGRSADAATQREQRGVSSPFQAGASAGLR